MDRPPLGNYPNAVLSGYAIGLLDATPKSELTIDQMLERVDDQISHLWKYVDEVGTITNILCGSTPSKGETDDHPERVPNGLREKIENREYRLKLLLNDLAMSVERLQSL